MIRVLVCIPTLRARQPYLANCMRGYRERTPGAEVVFSIVADLPTCGVGWNATAANIEELRGIDYIHFSNDDVVVGEGWLAPLIEACQAGCVPAPRIEPAGVHVGEFPLCEPPMAPSGFPPPRSPHGFFYADLPEKQPVSDWKYVPHGALPFCSVAQWREIGPFIPTHFGTDKWFYHRASALGLKIVARQGSVIYNYAPQIGRARGDWTEQDYLDFDLTVAYPMYVSGDLSVTERHPLRETPEGQRLVREWRERTFG